VLMGVDFWRPMLDFLRGTMVKHGTIGAADVDRMLVTDDADEATAFIRDRAGKHLQQPRRRARKVLGERVTDPRPRPAGS